MWFAETKRKFNENVFGWDKFVSLEDLSNSTLGYIVDETLKLRVHFEVKVVEFYILL